jgi:tellurite resistance protein
MTLLNFRRTGAEETMRTRDALKAPEALVLTMVLVSAADGGITDREIGVMSGQVQTLPAFQNFTTDQLVDVTDAAVGLLREENGLVRAGELIRAALSPKLRETAYALACEVIAGDQDAKPKRQSLEMLDFVRGELGLDPLVSGAIERGVRARHQRVDPVT